MSPDVKEIEIWDKIVNSIERCREKGVEWRSFISKTIFWTKPQFIKEWVSFSGNSACLKAYAAKHLFVLFLTYF